MGNEITVVHQVRQAMDKMRPELASVLPAHLPVDMFVRITQTALQNNPRLQSCTPRSIIAAATKCAEAGLQPDGEEAALVDFKGQAKFMPMVRGIRNQVQRSGLVKDWKVRIVYSQDKFRHIDGDVEVLEHEPAYVEGDHPILVYSIAYLENGELSRHVMRMDTVNKIRARSQMKDSGPWITDTPEMIKKTCLKQHSKALPKAKEDLARQRIETSLRALDDAEGVTDVEHSPAYDAPRLSHHQVATQRLREAAEADAFDEVEDGEQFAPDNLPNPAPEAPKRTRAPKKTTAEKLAEVEAGRQERLARASGNGSAAPAAEQRQPSSSPQNSPAASTSLATPAHAERRSDLVDHFIAEDEALEAERHADEGRDFDYEQQMSENPEPNGFRDAEPEAVAPHARPEAAAFSDGWDSRFKGQTRFPPRTLTHQKDVKAWMDGYDAAQKTVDINNAPGNPKASRIMCDNMISKLYP